MANDNPKLGPTGKFPQGKFGKDDEGELQFGVAAKGGKVLISFGKPIAWLAMDAALAEALAKVLLARAAEVRRSIT